MGKVRPGDRCGRFSCSRRRSRERLPSHFARAAGILAWTSSRWRKTTRYGVFLMRADFRLSV